MGYSHCIDSQTELICFSDARYGSSTTLSGYLIYSPLLNTGVSECYAAIGYSDDRNVTTWITLARPLRCTGKGVLLEPPF